MKQTPREIRKPAIHRRSGGDPGNAKKIGGDGVRGRTEVGLEEPLRVLLHVAAVDGRHGGRVRPQPYRARALGFWRSAPGGLLELPEERRVLQRSAEGEGSVATTRMGSPVLGRRRGLSRARDRAEGLEWGERRGRTRRKTRARWASCYTRTDRPGQFSLCVGTV